MSMSLLVADRARHSVRNHANRFNPVFMLVQLGFRCPSAGTLTSKQGMKFVYRMYRLSLVSPYKTLSVK